MRPMIMKNMFYKLLSPSVTKIDSWLYLWNLGLLYSNIAHIKLLETNISHRNTQEHVPQRCIRAIHATTLQTSHMIMAHNPIHPLEIIAPHIMPHHNCTEHSKKEHQSWIPWNINGQVNIYPRSRSKHSVLFT